LAAPKIREGVGENGFWIRGNWKWKLHVAETISVTRKFSWRQRAAVASLFLDMLPSGSHWLQSSELAFEFSLTICRFTANNRKPETRNRVSQFMHVADLNFILKFFFSSFVLVYLAPPKCHWWRNFSVPQLTLQIKKLIIN